MARYILLMTLTPEGRERMAADPERVLRAASEVRTADTHMLGLYGVLGNYDFVAIIESSDNAGIARFSLDLGVAAGVHITTLPAIPIARFRSPEPRRRVRLRGPTQLPIRRGHNRYGTLASIGSRCKKVAGCGKIRTRQFDATG